VKLQGESEPLGAFWTPDGRITEGGCVSWKPDGSDGGPVGTRTVGHGCADGGSRLSPDSREKLVLRGWDRGLYIVRVSDGKRLLKISHGVDDATWGPGKKILYVDRNDKLVVVNPDGSDRHRVRLDGADEAGPTEAFWTPSGRISSGCWSWKPDGSDRRRLTRPPGWAVDCAGSFSPDRRERVVARGDHLDIVRVSDGKRLRRLTTSGDVVHVSWGPGKQIIWVQDNGDDSQGKCGD